MKARNSLAAGIVVCAVLSPAACHRARRQDDKTIIKEIQSKLYRDTILKTRDISIIAQSGVVILSGQVSSEDEKSSVERLAAGAGGVKRVINQLAVVRPSPPPGPPAQQAAAPKRSPPPKAKK